MKTPMKTNLSRSLRSSGTLLVTAVAALGLAACSAAMTKPDGAEDVRSKLTRLQADPQLASRASSATPRRCPAAISCWPGAHSSSAGRIQAWAAQAAINSIQPASELAALTPLPGSATAGGAAGLSSGRTSSWGSTRPLPGGTTAPVRMRTACPACSEPV